MIRIYVAARKPSFVSTIIRTGKFLVLLQEKQGLPVAAIKFRWLCFLLLGIHLIGSHGMMLQSACKYTLILCQIDKIVARSKV